jgi:CheY-like chemotaxis protein
VIVDSDVPGTSGAAVTREIKNTERGRATPVILIAAGPLEESQRAQALTASGCTMVLQKPLMPQDLIDTMTRFLPNAFIGERQVRRQPAKRRARLRAAPRAS